MEKLKMLSNKILCVVFLMISMLFLLFFVLRIDSGTTLVGENSIVEVPSISTKKILTGEYQDEFTDWFSKKFPLKNNFTVMYNQFKYNIFNEINGDWMVGKNNYLFSKSQSETYSLGANDFSDQEYNEYASKVAKVQQELIKAGKSVMYVLNPIKAQIYPEELPDSYQHALKKNNNKTDTNYNKLKQAFDKYNVIYYDTEEDLKEIKKLEYPVFTKTGHHWNVYSSALVMDNIFTDLNSRYDCNLPQISIDSMSPGEANPIDKDIMNLTNLLWCEQDEVYYNPEVSYSNKSNKRVFLYGTSFGNEMVAALRFQDQAVDSIIYYEYFTNKHYYDMSGEQVKSFNEGEALSNNDILTDIDGSDIILIEENGIMGIPDTHKQFINFLYNNLEVTKNTGQQVNISNLEGTNWYETESWGRWSKGNDCSITLQLPEDKKYDTIINIKLLSYNSNRKVNVKANDISINTINVTTEPSNYEITIPGNIVKTSDKIKLEFELEGEIYSPSDIDKTEDTRRLGIGLVELSFK